MNILSIQSHVAYGHVGNSVAVFALQRLGHQVWPVNTVRFSNHPGHGTFRGGASTPREVAEIVAGLEELGVLETCDAVLSGYLPTAEIGDAVLDAVSRVKARNPAAVYFCDPVMGDRDRGVYVADEMPRFFRDRAIPAADIATPNLFELETLVSRGLAETEEILAALHELRAGGSAIAIATGVSRSGPEGDSVDSVAVTPAGAFAVSVPEISLGRREDGAGDLFSAVFLGHFLDGRDAGAALGHAAAATYGVLRVTADGDAPELRLVDAQDELVAPSRAVAVRNLDAAL